MSSTLSSYIKLPEYQINSASNTVSTVFSDVAAAKARFEAFKEQLNEQFNEKGVVRSYLILGALVILLHGLAVIAYISRDTSSTLVVATKHEVAIEFIKPEIISPPPIDPPKPPPPPRAKVQKVPPPPAPAFRTPVADQVIEPNDITIAENNEAPRTTGPVVAAAEPYVEPAPAPEAEEPVTEATANAAYLHNPNPEYPPAAQRLNWGGTVILRVRVLADGHAESVSVKKSSNHKVLDDSAVAAVKNWTFVPSKRGSTPVDGWATVPIIFNPEQ